jgi:hypothetical protein
MEREALKLALEALESDHPDIQLRAQITLRAVLAQPAQEPVAWIDIDDKGNRSNLKAYSDENYDEKPLYTASPQRPWVGLTEKDFSAINQSCLTKLQAATSAESILKERNS